jgi:pyrimidine-specific ribonucleoside hydrolase
MKCFARSLFTLLLVIAIPLAAAETKPPAHKRVIISSDLALGLQGGWRLMDDADDGWAVPMALSDDRLDVKLVATVLGNSNVAAEQVVSDRLLGDILRSRVPRPRGAAVALDNPQATLNSRPIMRDCENDAVRAMMSVLRAGRATIVAIGPLTDVGCLVLNAPDAVVENIDEVIAIMGRAPDEQFAIGKIDGLTDFNLVMDNRALEVLLNQSSVHMTFLQFALTKQVLVPRSVVAALRDGTPLQRFVYDGTMPWIDFWQRVFAEDGFHPWDSNAVWYASHPDAFACSDANFVIKQCSSGSSDPYNRLGGCAGHSATQKTSLDREAVQLWLSAGISQSRTVRTCTSYRNADEQQHFEQAVSAFLKMK